MIFSEMRRRGNEVMKKGKGQKAKACHVKCDVYPVKFEVRKYFNREGAYFTVGKREEEEMMGN